MESTKIIKILKQDGWVQCHQKVGDGTIPDILGCYSAGSSYDEVLQNAMEAIECHLEGLLLDGEPLPIASSIDTWINHEDFKDGVFALVDIDLSQITGKVKLH